MQVNKPLLEKMQTPPTSAIAVRVEAEIDEDDELRAIEATAAVAMARYRPQHRQSTRVCASAARRCRFERTTATASPVQHRTGLYRPLGWLLAMARGASSYDRQSDTQRIERKHLTLRVRIKRLARKTLCFSKSVQMHDAVIGLFIDRYEFGLDV